MKTIHNYRELALKQLGIMYRSENQYILYLKVFSHKAHTDGLKMLLLELIMQAETKLDFLAKVMKELDYKHSPTGTEGMNGIFKEGFRLLEQDSNAVLVDATLLHVLILSGNYKLGNYRTLQLYFRSLNFERPAKILEEIVHMEEAALDRIIELIKEDYIVNVFKPQLDTSLA